MKKYSALLLLSILFITSANAQFFINPKRKKHQSPESRRQSEQTFQPTVNILLGYGFPNLDRDEFLHFGNFYHGSMSQTGPVFGQIDYQFNKVTSIGAMVSYGKVSTPYYSDNTSYLAFTGSLQSWSFMLNLMRYFPTSGKVNPYIRTALGINIWTQSYLDPSGNKAVTADDPSAFAYQTSIGAKFNFSKQAGLFLEAGYGKYILSGGLSFKF